MQNLARRGFLRLLPALPIAAKAAADSGIANLSGISLGGVERGGDGCAPTASAEVPRDQVAAVLKNAAARAEIRSLLFEDQRMVSRIDPDLAVYRSFSLNAKVAFQRQRNVERRLEELGAEWMWKRVQDKLKSFLTVKIF